LEEDKKTREPDITVGAIISRAANAPLYEAALRRAQEVLRKPRATRAEREGTAEFIDTILKIGKGD
jgi:hypothetical protein